MFIVWEVDGHGNVKVFLSKVTKMDRLVSRQSLEGSRLIVEVEF